MRLSVLERLPSFALLGPGFGGDGWLFLPDLRPSTGARTGRGGTMELALVEFEARGGEARRFSSACAVSVRPVFDVPPLAAGHEVTLRVPGYAAAVDRIRAAIAAGDVYQVCYTVRAEVAPVGGASLLAALCAAGLPRFAAWVRLPDGGEIVSASPELFFTVEGRRVRTEPMKGTARPDAAGVLLPSEKERSELAMITDLLRNDLTSVCVPRTVRVINPRRLIELPYALQCVSDIEGELEAGVTALDVLAALHPGGSVTGAPKGAAVEMIRALESGPRGAYCGALGLLRRDRATFALLIRTAQRHRVGWTYGVGSGVVWDSDPDGELAELHVKLGALGCDIRCFG